MRFSSSKTVPIIFARGKYDKPARIILNGVPLEYGKVVKYLGVYIDSQLLWTEHVKIKIKKAKKLLMNKSRVCHPTWGISPWAAIYYWKCCILPMFTFGCLVWHKVYRNKTVQDDLKRFQRLALKLMGPLRKSTPTRGLEILSYCRPIELECRWLAAQAYIRTQGMEKIPNDLMYTRKTTKVGHRQLCQEYLREVQYPFINTPLDQCTRKWHWNKKYQVDFSNKGQPKYDSFIQIYGGHHLHNYHDAMSAGAAIIVNENVDQESFKLGPHIEESQAALFSIKKAAAWLLKNQNEIVDKNVAIYTYFKAALTILDKVVVTSKLELQVMDMLNAAASKCNNIFLRYIAKGNGNSCQARALATEAAKSQGPPTKDVPLPTKDTSSKLLAKGTDRIWSILFDLIHISIYILGILRSVGKPNNGGPHQTKHGQINCWP